MEYFGFTFLAQVSVLGFFLKSHISVFQVHKALDACKSVLRGLHSNKIAPRELDRVSVIYVNDVH